MKSLAMIAFCLGVATGFSAKADDALDEARIHLQKGRYAEAGDAYRKLLDSENDAIEAAIGLSRALEAQGEREEAISLIEKTLAGHPKSAVLSARMAELLLRRGRYDQAEKQARRAIALEADQPLAHLVLADALAEQGRLDAADAEYRWFVRYYNRVQPTDAETLLLVARGSLQYARWHSVSQIFDFVVNTLCPDALKADANAWEAHSLSGRVLLEKYNRADAIPELKKALAINPRAADVLLALGDAALQQRDFEETRARTGEVLKIDAENPAAANLLAEIALAGGNSRLALEALAAARETNPHDQRTLARLAACYVLEDGVPGDERLEHLFGNIDAPKQIQLDEPNRFERLVIELAERNPHPGYFLYRLGETLESRLRFDMAERAYRQAIRVMPQLSEPKSALGMLCMRIGRNEEAAKILDDAFRADPYHVRVSNMRKVLKLLAGYRTIETDHFVIRVDSELDAVLGEYMAEYLEEIYPELVKQYGFEPPHRTHFEIYNDAKGLSAHQWFSARMVGLPWIQTIGASTGVMVAMTSPTAAEKPFNWTRVLKHEFVHVITLQQTKFNIPHWFTEALAVTAEDSPRPDEWDALLLERVPAGKLWSLDELNEEFTRPETPADRQFAYCQSRLYAQYMIEEFGSDKIPEMLAAYRANVETRTAIPRVFDVDVATFEKGYRAFLAEIVADLRRNMPPKDSRTLAELEKAHRDAPRDSSVSGAYARALFESRSRRQARKIAELAIRVDEQNADAAIVLAQLELIAGNIATAIDRLEAALDHDHPHPEVLKLLAVAQSRAGKTDEAEKSYELGRRTFPHDADHLRGLAKIHRLRSQEDKLREVLAALAARDPDDAASRKELARSFLAKQDFAQVVEYGRQAMRIDVLDANLHATLARAYLGQGNTARAVREFNIAVQLRPGDDELEFALAEVQHALGLDDAARQSLKHILERTPDHAEARKLFDELK